MNLTVAGLPVRVYTGGRDFDAGRPAVLLLHGAGHDRSVWNLQARHLARLGLAVLAPDLPHHGASAGPALSSIEALADWAGALLDAAGIGRAALVGHSMGALVALQAAARAPQRVSRLALVGCAVPMPVSAPLLDAARDDPAAAHAMINAWSYAAPLGPSAVPGLWAAALNLRLMERQPEGTLATDLAACNAYAGGLEAAAAVRCPTLLVSGERDRMTPPRALGPVLEALVTGAASTRMIAIPGAGHAVMSEAPDAVNQSLRGFLTDT